MKCFPIVLVCRSSKWKPIVSIFGAFQELDKMMMDEPNHTVPKVATRKMAGGTRFNQNQTVVAVIVWWWNHFFCLIKISTIRTYEKVGASIQRLNCWAASAFSWGQKNVSAGGCKWKENKKDFFFHRNNDKRTFTIALINLSFAEISAQPNLNFVVGSKPNDSVK